MKCKGIDVSGKRKKDLLITNQLLYQLSYAGMLAGPAVSTAGKQIF